MSRFYRLLILLFLFQNCSKENEIKTSNAEVIAFHANKCMCCWGWDIKTENDTIRTESGIVSEVVGFEITTPVPVVLELGEKSEVCPLTEEGFKHFEVISIQKAD